MYKIILISCLIIRGGQLSAQADSARIKWIRTIPEELKRVQMPHGPYSYSEQDISFSNTVTGLVYGATLTIPAGTKNFSTVILISGTGAQDRDYTAYFHKFFWVLADYLSTHGIAVLRIDDRGINGTTGDFASSTTEDFARDISAAVDYLRSRKDIDPGKIGLIGHSEGGIIAPMVYADNPGHISFMVLLAAPVIGLRAINRFQTFQSLQQSGLSNTLVAARMELHESILNNIPLSVKNEYDLNQIISVSLRKFCSGKKVSVLDSLGINENESMINALNRSYKGYLSPWWQFILNYNPVIDIRKIHCPVLAVFGTKDLQVPPSSDYQVLRENLPPNEKSQLLVAEGINHFMQPAKTGTEREYFYINETISTQIEENISKWINSLF